MTFAKSLARLIAAFLMFTLCGAPQFLQAWQQPTSPAPAGGETQAAPAPTPAPGTTAPASGTGAQPATLPPAAGSAQKPAPAPQQGNSPAQSGTTVDPSQGPLEPTPGEPAPEALPSAEGAQPEGAAQQQPAKDDTVVDQLPEKPAPQKPSQPLGTATAERGRTAGGAASKPAGTAIAPAKQRQVRSFLIKFGAIAGAGIALGTIYMLSHKTSSTPPGALR